MSSNIPRSENPNHNADETQINLNLSLSLPSNAISENSNRNVENTQVNNAVVSGTTSASSFTLRPSLPFQSYGQNNQELGACVMMSNTFNRAFNNPITQRPPMLSRPSATPQYYGQSNQEHSSGNMMPNTFNQAFNNPIMQRPPMLSRSQHNHNSTILGRPLLPNNYGRSTPRPPHNFFHTTRSNEISVYDPRREELGIPIDPYLRLMEFDDTFSSIMKKGQVKKTKVSGPKQNK